MSKPSRIKPPLGHDNAWWWEQADLGKLAIQRCLGCEVLRHPPRPMCEQCRSMEWDFIESNGRGTVASYTILHHPQIPGYVYPLAMVLVDLDEGTRLTAQLMDCDTDKVDFGMSVQIKIHEDDDGFKIPVFIPAVEEA